MSAAPSPSAPSTDLRCLPYHAPPRLTETLLDTTYLPRLIGLCQAEPLRVQPAMCFLGLPFPSGARRTSTQLACRNVQYKPNPSVTRRASPAVQYPNVPVRALPLLGMPALPLLETPRLGLTRLTCYAASWLLADVAFSISWKTPSNCANPKSFSYFLLKACSSFSASAKRTSLSISSFITSTIER